MKAPSSDRPATLYLMIGLPCSGKTTRAKQLETERAALRLTPDDWHVPLFGRDIFDPDHDRRHNTIEALLWQLAAQALALGVNVILDFGFWAREEREEFRARAGALGARSELVYLDVSEEELLRRMHERNRNLDAGDHFIPEDMMRSWFGLFEKPAAAELLAREVEAPPPA